MMAGAAVQRGATCGGVLINGGHSMALALRILLTQRDLIGNGALILQVGRETCIDNSAHGLSLAGPSTSTVILVATI
jgi:hypothetical protein